MRINKNKTRLGANLLSLFLALVSISCCMCGWLNSAAGMMSSAPVDINGQRISPELNQQMVIANGYLFTIVALVILLAGLTTWNFYGRERQDDKKGTKTIISFLFIGSLGCCLWSGLVFISFPAVQLILPIEGAFVPAIPFLSALFCMVPAFLMALGGGLTWIIAIRGQDKEVVHER